MNPDLVISPTSFIISFSQQSRESIDNNDLARSGLLHFKAFFSPPNPDNSLKGPVVVDCILNSSQGGFPDQRGGREGC